MNSSASTSSAQRRQALAARRALPLATRRSASNAICERFIRSHEFMAAKAIGCYLPMQDEVDPVRIIARAWRMHKAVFVPLMLGDDHMQFIRLRENTRLVRNHFGIWEPRGTESINAAGLDLVVTPLVAFDNHCNRIGMGGGYYDRFFAHLRHRQKWRRPKLVGVAFDCQSVEKISTNPWDIQLYKILTESTARYSATGKP